MSNYLGVCETIEELSLRRNNIMAEINKEYSDKRKDLAGRAPTFKAIPFIQVPAVSGDLPVYSNFSFVEGSVPANVIRIEQGKPLEI